MSNEQIVMLTRARVAGLSGVSERKLDYWERTGLLSTTVETSLTGARKIRLLDFNDAMTAMVLSALRKRVSLQHVRQIVDHLRDLQFGVTEVAFAIAGNRVHFQLPDGTWSDFDDPGQIVIHEVLNLEPLRAAVLGAGRRRAEDAGQIVRRRGSLGSKPVISGTRIPVQSVRAYLDHGVSDDEILQAYPALTPADVEAVRSLASA